MVRGSSIVPEVGLLAYPRTGDTGAWVVVRVSGDQVEIAQFDEDSCRQTRTVTPDEIDCVA